MGISHSAKVADSLSQRRGRECAFPAPILLLAVSASSWAIACGSGDSTARQLDAGDSSIHRADAARTDVAADRIESEPQKRDAAKDREPPSDSEASGCVPLRDYVFTSTADVALGCDASMPVTILDQPIPVTGRAVGRAIFSVQHAGSSPVTHFWNLQVQVGGPIDAYGLGDDVCAGVTSIRGNLGYGTSTASSNRARLVGYSGASPCTPGTLTVLAGATLEVWVEDDAPGCQGKDIAFGSYYASNGVTTYYDWTTSYTLLPGVTASLTTTGASEKMRVMGVVEGSPHQDPNTTCGTEVSTIDMQTALDGAPMVYLREVVPASEGMGHRVIATSGDVDEIRYVTPGMHAASLLVASDFVVPGEPVTTGGCCGDGEVALLRLR